MASLESADYVVVGGGVAGCVVARTLADASANVLLIEAGPNDLPDQLRSLDWLGKADDSQWLWPGDYPRGRGLGGGSAINGMVAASDSPEFYDRWPVGWQYQDLAEFLTEVTAKVGIRETKAGNLLNAIAGLDSPDLAASTHPLQLFADPGGQRRTFADAYLSDAPDHLMIEALAEVGQLVNSDNAVVGVDLTNGTRINCTKVVLCAGTLGTASLLRASGIALNHRRAKDHRSVTITIDLAQGFRTKTPNAAPTSARIVAPGFEIIVLDHLGGDRGQGALMVGEMEEAGLTKGVRLATEIVDGLLTGGVATRSVESPGGYYHAASTLPGGAVVDRTGAPEGWNGLHIMDASVLPSLVRCSPSLTIAAVAAMLATNLANS